MRSLKDNSSITPVTVNSNYPDGQIIDETTSVQGTAVIEEIYGDILSNIYKAIRVTGGATTGVPDNESTAYQFLDALQKLPNIYNDTLRVLTLSSTTFTVDMNIDLLPDKYFFFAKVVGAYGAGPYTIKGSGSVSYNFTSAGFNDAAYLLVFLTHAGAVAISLTSGNTAGGSITKTASDLLGSDPFFFLPLTGTVVPAVPKYLTMYIQNGDSDNQNKLIGPVAYVADTRIITGMPSPTDWPSMVITLYFA